mgnify:CR=1 FL=1
MPYGLEESSYNRVHLFLNDGGALSDVAPALGLDVMGYGETPNWGDFNADGKSDVLWRETGGVVAAWLMNGATLLGGPLVGGASSAWAKASSNFPAKNKAWNSDA